MEDGLFFVARSDPKPDESEALEASSLMLPVIAALLVVRFVIIVCPVEFGLLALVICGSEVTRIPTVSKCEKKINKINKETYMAYLLVSLSCWMEAL